MRRSNQAGILKLRARAQQGRVGSGRAQPRTWSFANHDCPSRTARESTLLVPSSPDVLLWGSKVQGWKLLRSSLDREGPLSKPSMAWIVKTFDSTLDPSPYGDHRAWVWLDGMGSSLSDNYASFCGNSIHHVSLERSSVTRPLFLFLT